mgnify:CR=1 FL=1
MKHGFELLGFFLEPKTAYLEALLYLQKNRKLEQVLISAYPYSYQAIGYYLGRNKVEKLKHKLSNICGQLKSYLENGPKGAFESFVRTFLAALCSSLV